MKETLHLGAQCTWEGWGECTRPSSTSGEEVTAHKEGGWVASPNRALPLLEQDPQVSMLQELVAFTERSPATFGLSATDYTRDD